MLKVRKDGVVIEGAFDDADIYVPLIAETEFATLIVRVRIETFEDKCIEITSALANICKQYGTDFIIARTRAGTFGNEGIYGS